MTVKDILSMLANCPPEASVNVAVNNGIEMQVYPANQIQILVTTIEGKEIKNLLVITNTTKK